MTHYLNSRSGFSTWVIWSWRAFLSLDNYDQEKYASQNQSEYKSFETYKEFLTYGSNNEAVRRSILRKNHPKLWRMVEPAIEIPTGLDSKNAPKFIISVATGDPLYDEGVAFADILKKNGANVTLVESKSAHTCGMDFDRTFTKKIIDAWRPIIFIK